MKAGVGLLISTARVTLTQMRRGAALLAVIALLLALPTAAVALSRVLHGPAGAGRSATVDIQFNIRNGHPTKITRLELNNIPATCQGGPPTATYYPFAHQIPVSRDGRFHARETSGGGRTVYAVSGQFFGPFSRTKGPFKAVGNLRIKGPVTGCGSADTGRVHWSATRT